MPSAFRQTVRYAIYDDVLPPDMFARLVGDLQRLRYDYRNSEWRKLWPLGDPASVSSDAFHWSRKPFGFGLDLVASAIEDRIRDSYSTGLLAEEWAEIGFRVYIHPPGSRLKCHSDSPKNVGAAVYYAHKEWHPEWGGELVFPEVSPIETWGPERLSDGPIDNSRMRDAIAQTFLGEYVAPKPNRLVVIRGGVWHYTNRVDTSAGDNARVSIASFLQREIVGTANDSPSFT